MQQLHSKTNIGAGAACCYNGFQDDAASPLHANRSAALDMMQLYLVCFGHCSARQVSVPV